VFELIVFLLIGIFSGISAGLFGIGGGLIVVPALVMIYQSQGMPAEYIMQTAVSTSLMTILITSLSSAYAHHRYHHINWSIVHVLGPGLLLGAFVAAYFILSVPSSLLQQCFVIYMALAALKIWLPSPVGVNSSLLSTPLLFVFGVIAGGFSALVGVGGGTVIVPYLVTAKQPIKQAIGSASACGFFIALAAVVGVLVLAGQQNQLDIERHQAIIDWNAFVGISLTSVIFSRVGAYFSERLPVSLLRRIFSLLLLIVAVKMWLSVA
jgi:uncharacterized membrane protein YfcA